jgi:hypothetical protein
MTTKKQEYKEKLIELLISLEKHLNIHLDEGYPNYYAVSYRLDVEYFENMIFKLLEMKQKR